MSKGLFSIIAIIATTIAIVGCDTDVKPNYFIGMFRDSGDIDRLSECLSSIPEVDNEGNIIIKADSQCLIDLSNRDTTDPNMDVSFSEILNDPESYMDRLLTFEAVVKRLHYNAHPELYTNRRQMEFHINTHGAPLFWIDADGEEQDIVPNQKYAFKCRIHEILILTTGVWRIQAEFIVSQSKKIVFQPVPLEIE
ncbi:MAG: hypothetical protein OXD54_11560 [Candidatus Poribacteria bacterium]|nr:hypothetical protein [Candidatus Poribacteria bacterium]